MGDPAEALAEWLRGRMRERGLGQRQLARFVGLSPTTVGRILRAESTPRAEVVLLLAEYFGEEPAAVLARAGLSALEDAPEDARAEAAELLRRLYALKPADRQRITRQLNEILAFLEREDAAAGATPRWGPSLRRAGRRARAMR